MENGGALISEFPPGYRPSKYTFPVRNRILSALSLGVIVGEAPSKSGALITARHALDMGRDMFAIPGSVMSELSEAANMMIRDGAKSVSCAFDVLEEYNSKYPHRLVMRGSQKPISQIVRSAPEYVDVQFADGYSFRNNGMVNRNRNELIEQIKIVKGRAVPLHSGASDNAEKVYTALLDCSLNMEELCSRLSMTAQNLLVAITELEISDIIASDLHRKYYIKRQ